MPELPDLVVLARSMTAALASKTIAAVDINQPKCINLPIDEYQARAIGRTFGETQQRGKWALAALDDGSTLAFNLGMGGEVRLRRAEEIPDPARERLGFRLDTGEQVWAHFWWFGSVHWIAPGALSHHPQIGRLGPEPLDNAFTPERLAEMLHNRRGAIKKYLLDQSFIAGIGNVYVQDTLWLARLHPLRPANTLTEQDIRRLHQAIRDTLREGIRWGGGPGEQDIWGNPGQYSDHLWVGYQTGKPCPQCGTPIEAIRVGSTTSYICPVCQTAPVPTPGI